MVANMTRKKLEFLIIGAQKSGTTALHKYLEQNPHLYLPPEKEAIFFSDDLRYKKGIDWYFKEFFGSADSNVKWGKATPAYSCYPDISATRIYNHNQDIKLIYILRDPIERAISQYKMNKKRGLATAEINSQFSNLSKEKELQNSRINASELNSYLIWSEYSRIINIYSSLCNKNNLLLIDDNFLKNDTPEAVKTISEFLGIKYTYTNKFKEKFHVGGIRRFKFIDIIKEITILKQAWRLAIPDKYRRRFAFWMDQWNTKSIGEVSEFKLSEELNSHLKIKFTPEYDLIEKLKASGGKLIV